MKVTEVLVKIHEESLDCGSLIEFLKPSRHLTSSSMAVMKVQRERKRMRRVGEENVRWVFMVVGLAPLGFMDRMEGIYGIKGEGK